ncbi:MAG: hypothetical protein N7Q72_07640 [Spiroplasma sp. Tabriz.8]|nr:hypothetical protein [Spiroplasma sp. Tabriz.8]
MHLLYIYIYIYIYIFFLINHVCVKKNNEKHFWYTKVAFSHML